MSNPFASEEYVELIVPNSMINDIVSDVPPIEVNSKISILPVHANTLTENSVSEYYYSNIPSIYVTESIETYDEINLNYIQKNPHLNLTGQGVLIGCIDTGIDYTNDAFINADNTSKIVSIWDQTITSEHPPNGFTYGTEYTREDINKALEQETPLSYVPSTDNNGHGTHIAGIIVGNENKAEGFMGIAPNASIVTVKLKTAKKKLLEIMHYPSIDDCYQETDILLAIKYIYTKSMELNMPLVLCITLGTNQGGHDGSDVTSRYLNEITSNPGACVVISAGNEGTSRKHYHGIMSNTEDYREFELKVDKKDQTFNLEIWHKTPYKTSVEIISPSGETTTQIYPSIKQTYNYKFVLSPSTLYINNIITESETGDQLILLRFSNASEGIWKIRLYNVEVPRNIIFDAWLPMSTILSEDTYFLISETDITITSPGNANAPITVTAYNPSNGGIYFKSSRGYTRTGIVKPDLSAPGVNVLSPTLNNRYINISGASVATAIVAGCVALTFEWSIVNDNYPNLNGIEIKTLLYRGAVQASNLEYPNKIWGFGKVNLGNFFEEIIPRY